MMSIEGVGLLTSLSNARWRTVTRAFGSAHSTLIGVLVDWWTNGDHESRWALDGGPSFGYRERAAGGGGQCDAILGEDNDAVGVVEVEANRIPDTIRKIGSFFKGEYPEIQSLRFAICLLYATTPQGRGQERHFPSVKSSQVKEDLARLSAEYRDRSVILVAVDKDYRRPEARIRRRNPYYYGTVSEITGTLFLNGVEEGVVTYWQACRPPP